MGDVENPMQVRPSPGGTEKVAEPSTNAQDEHEQAKSLPGEALPHKLSWYKLHEPIPVSDVLFLKPRTIILLRYVVHMSIALSKIVFLPVALLLIPLLVIIRPLLRRKWPEAAKAISFPAIYFKFEHILWVSTFESSNDPSQKDSETDTSTERHLF
jgi:hypothetical protein